MADFRKELVTVTNHLHDAFYVVLYLHPGNNHYCITRAMKYSASAKYHENTSTLHLKTFLPDVTRHNSMISYSICF